MIRLQRKLIFLKKICFKKKFLNFLFGQNEKLSLRVYDKGLICFLNLISKKLLVYNGYKFNNFYVKKIMLNQYIGKYILTKKIGTSIHVLKKNKKLAKLIKKN